MKIRTLFLVAPLLIAPPGVRAAIVSIGFEDVGRSLGTNSFYNGSDGAGGFTSGGAFFNNSYLPDPLFPSWTGWSYSNTTDTTSPGFMNQYSAFAATPGGHASATYGVAFTGRPENQGSIDDKYDFSYINLPALDGPIASASAWITNTTYTALSIRDGDSFVTKYGGPGGTDPDFLLLRITGFAGLDKTGPTTGGLDFYLADYRPSDSSQDSFIADWTSVNLAPLLAAPGLRSIGFEISSSKVGTFGINTPTYFALDDLTLVTAPAVVPEPPAYVLTALGAVAIALASRRVAG